MAALSENKRHRVWQELMQERRFPQNIQKLDLRAAVDAGDDWLEANWLASSSTGFNAALPQPYRGAATRNHKEYLQGKLALARAGEGV